MPNIYKVENPVYQSDAEIWEQYRENLIVVTNIERDGSYFSRFVGGIVRYYGDDRKKLINMWGDLNDSDEYGECQFKTLMMDREVHVHG